MKNEMHAVHKANQPRPTLVEAIGMLTSRGWEPSSCCLESEHTVFVFSQESYPGKYGGAAAAVSWNASGYLSLPESKPDNVKFV